MTGLESARAAEPAAMPPGTGDQLAASARLQILATEHWSLLATRSLSWNEAFSRAAMFLTLLAGATVALALAAQAMSFGESFRVFALLVLAVVLFVGVATDIRLVQINREDAIWVMGMNRLRHAYLELAPELARYFVTGWHDDEAGVRLTFAAPPPERSQLHGLVTTPGMVAVVDALIAAVLAAIAAVQLGASSAAAIIVGVAAFVVVSLALFAYGYRIVGAAPQPPPRFPADPGA